MNQTSCRRLCRRASRARMCFLNLTWTTTCTSYVSDEHIYTAGTTLTFKIAGQTQPLDLEETSESEAEEERPPKTKISAHRKTPAASKTSNKTARGSKVNQRSGRSDPLRGRGLMVLGSGSCRMALVSTFTVVRRDLVSTACISVKPSLTP